MFAPRGYTAVPQDASQDEEENENLTRSFEQRKTLSASKNSDALSTPRTSGESEEGESRERRSKRNVRFESRSMEEKPEPMSNARRLCFVVSLMICTLTIFVFAFTVPCKGPSCNVANMITTVTSNLEAFHRNWSTTFSGYSTGIAFHLSSTKTNEVVVSYAGKTVKSKGKHRRGNSGIISLREDNGDLVWSYNASDVIKLIECTTDNNHFETCLIRSSHGKLQLINPKRNQIVWSTRILIGSMLPSIIIGINDCDGDGGRDVLLSYDQFNTTCMPPSANKTTCTHPGIVQLLSGRTGYRMGNGLNIPQSHLIKRVSVHSTRRSENLIFVLTVGNKGHLKVLSIEELYRKILAARGDGPAYLFQNSTLSVSDVVSTDHEPVVKDLNKDFVEDIVLVTLAGNKHSLTAVDGGKLKRMWRIAFGSRKMLSQPVIGYFNDDDTPDILVILQDPVLSLLNQSLVQILDGQNGNILWSRKLRVAKNTSPLSANIAYKSDVFLLWIEKDSKRKYKKVFLSQSVEDLSKHPKSETHSSESSSSGGQKNTSEKTIAQGVTHHRSPRSVQSDEEKTSPVADMESELDSLVDEIYAEHVGNTLSARPHAKPRLKAKKMENTHKVLEDILKEEVRSSKMAEKRRHQEANSASSIHGKSNTKVKKGEKDKQRMVTNPGTRMNSPKRPTVPHNNSVPGRPSSAVALSTKSPTLLHNDHGETKKFVSKKSKKEKTEHVLLIDSHNSGDVHNGHRTSTTSTTQHPMLYDSIHFTTRRPSTMSNWKETQQRLRNSPDTRGTGEGVSEMRATLLPLLHDSSRPVTTRPTTTVKNWKSVQELRRKSLDGRINGKSSGVTSTRTTQPPMLHDNILTLNTKPSTMVSSRKRIRTFVIHNSGGGTNDKDKSTTTGTQPLQRPVLSDSNHTITHKPSTEILTTRRVQQNTIYNRGSGINRGSQNHIATFPTHLPVSLGKIHLSTKKASVRVDESVSQVFIENQNNNINSIRDSAVGASSTRISLPQQKKQAMSKQQMSDSERIQQSNLLNTSLVNVFNEHNNVDQNNSTFFDSINGDTKLKDHTKSGNVELRSHIVKPNIGHPSASKHGHVEKHLSPKRLFSHKKDGNKFPKHGGKDVGPNDKNHSLVKHNQKVKSSGTATPSRKPQDVNTSKTKSNDKAKVERMDNMVKHRKGKPTKPHADGKAKQGKNAITNKSASSKESNGQLSPGKFNFSTKVGPHDNVLSNTSARGSKKMVDHGRKNSHSMKTNETRHLDENKLHQGNPTKPGQIVMKETSLKQHTLSLNITHGHQSKPGDLHTTVKAHSGSSKKKHDVYCTEGFDLALIAIFPNSRKNSFSVISQEDSFIQTRDLSAPASCHTRWPTLSSSPLVHDADSDGYLEVIYAVNYGADRQDDKIMKIKRFSIKVDSD